MANAFIGIALEETSQSILTKSNTIDTNVAGVKTDVADVKSDVSSVKTDVSSVSTDVADVKTVVDGHTTTLGTINTNASNAATNASTAATNAANAYTQAQTNATTLSTINTNVSSIKTTVATINTNAAATASSDACGKVLSTIAALDTTNLRYDPLLNGIVMNHSTYGWIEMVAIAFNVDGANYVTLKAAGPVAQSAWGTSGQDWSACTARTWCRGTFYNGIPTALKNKIKTVTKKVYLRSGSVGSNTETVWLLSATELGAAGSGGGGVAEGAPYAYFNGSRALGAACGYTRVSGSYEYSGGYCILRSPFGDDDDYVFATVGEHIIPPSGNTAEGVVSYHSVTTSNWMVPCFCVGT